MIELICSNYSPLIIPGAKQFEKVFFNELSKAESVQLASGYISNDSIAELISLYKDSSFHVNLNLIIGMHYFEGFTNPQYKSLIKLQNVLTERSLGTIYIATVSKYHGKVYSFLSKEGKYTSIIGSSNLSRICSPDKVYETDVIIMEQKFSKEIETFLEKMKKSYCKTLTTINNIKIIEDYKIFENHSDVIKVTDAERIETISKETDISFSIPLKETEKSNLNVYFGKGRQSQSGMIIPRNWYEVEIIVSNRITQKIGYPTKGKCFYVITDDGYKFSCKTSGDYSKNFRSSDDLKILGMWIKGRLEYNGCLEIGEKITKQTFEKYGRDTITFTKTTIPNTWTLSFKVK